MSKHAPRKPNPIDIHVGTRVRLRRQVMKMSQEKLGDQLGVTFQQVQKYERGANRVGASRLWKMSQILGVPVGFFFDGLGGEITELPIDDTGVVYDFVNSTDGISFAKAISKLTKITRTPLLALVRQMARDAEQSDG